MPRFIARRLHRLLVPVVAVVVLPLLAAGSSAAPATVAAAPTRAASAGWVPKTPPLTTPWTHLVSPSNALPEYPRPQLTRPRWANLNGVWQFAAATAGEAPPVGQDLRERILVPYPVESALSGVMRHETRMWYRRTFTVPTSWRVGAAGCAGPVTCPRLLLHFGAVDYASTVWVNGHRVATHTGGYDAFSADVTAALRPSGRQEVVVRVTDLTDAGWQPLGKQRHPGDGIFYTPSSGIWQTVWMEPVAAAHITRLDSIPDVAHSRLMVTAQTAGTSTGRVTAVAYAGRTMVGRVSGPIGSTLRLRVPHPRLWSPASPYLYRLKVRLTQGPRVVDAVGSYFGMRSISLGTGRDGNTRMLLNGKFVFQTGPLDQGFWPDGIYTAPTDAALKFDLQREKALGFNMVRKHMKVEPDRWYYWADRLGLLVWQDMPAMKVDFSLPRDENIPPPAARTEFVRELHRMVDLHRSFTSIAVWVPFNEGWGEWDRTATGRIATAVKSWDPSRLVDAHSGVNCCNSLGDSGRGSMYDDHTYVGPGAPGPHPGRATVDGEYGGLGLHTPGHEFDPENSFAYELEPDAATLTDRYVQVQRRMLTVERKCAVSAGVYTQTTDVEQEINGFLTYDRRVLKPDLGRVREANRALINASRNIGSAPPPSYPPGTPGPWGVTWYPMNEGSGTVVTDQADGHDGTVVGTATWVADHTGGTGAALAFDGTPGSYVDTGASILDTTGNYSIAAWVKLDAAGDGFETCVSQDSAGTGAASGFFLQYSGADHRFAFSVLSGRALAPTAPEPGRWYHLVGVRDAAAGQNRLYVDGQLAGTYSVCLGDPATGHTVIGRGQYGGNPVDFLNGSVDAVHLYDRALSGLEVSSLYTSGK